MRMPTQHPHRWTSMKRNSRNRARRTSFTATTVQVMDSFIITRPPTARPRLWTAGKRSSRFWKNTYLNIKTLKVFAEHSRSETKGAETLRLLNKKENTMCTMIVEKVKVD